MLAKTQSGGVYGVDASLVEIEVSIGSGGNGEFQIVGLPDTAIRESRARIEAAISNSGFEAPFRKITVNLAPASLPKEGVILDLPMAVGILTAKGIIKQDLSDYLIAGELSLDGTLRPIRGCLSIALLARAERIPKLIVAEENAIEASLADGVSVYPARTLSEVVSFVAGARAIEPWSRPPEEDSGAPGLTDEDFEDVKGQPHARRAIEVAVAGGHNVLMVGPPGAGKTMLARRIPSIMPVMTLEERLETTQVHSARGLVDSDRGIVARRPFRAPHHTVSSAGMVGGGMVPRPGEISLAHNGVLFLDELPEFSRTVLEALRQPLEEGRITITRSRMTLDFPATLMLVAAMNPCPCGYYGDLRRECVCTPKQIQRYMSRISGPVLDRIDIHVSVGAVSYKQISDQGRTECSSDMRRRVLSARQLQKDRFRKTTVHTNARMHPAQIRRWCRLNDESEKLLERAVAQLGLSARGWNRMLKVARTIADLAGIEEIGSSHVAEAIRYRCDPSSGLA